MKIIYFLFVISLFLMTARAQIRQSASPINDGRSAVLQTLLDSANQVWCARYNGPGDDWDEALAIAVDRSGNVYVTGGSPGMSGGAFDYATVKYNSSGDQEWAMRYSGTPYGVDEAFAIAIDDAGNVYVTGYSSGTGTSNDYATIKYNSAGVQQWAARYDGTANDDDAATALVVDNLGNVYVTGDSRSPGSYDYATVKYNSSGNQVWVARYNGTGNGFDQANDVAVDDSGNVFVTGWSAGLSGFYEYTTIKYNSLGTQQWVSRYTGPGGGESICTAMAIDPQDNVYITGGSSVSGAPYDFATVKYNSSGVQQWASRYDGPANDFDEAKDIKVDASGNVYIMGKSVGTNTGLDYATIKYDPSGNLEWAARYDAPLNIDDDPSALALDDAGNVYVTGVCVGLTSDYDYITIKYNGSGEQQWLTCYNGPGNMGDRPYGIAVDAAGSVYVTGYSYNEGTSFDYATVKYEQTPIPVELISFTAEAGTDGVILKWNTATEKNNRGFEIERSQKSPDGSVWEKIGFVNGAGTTSEPKFYSFTDQDVCVGSYLYRLKQVDFNGSYKYSNIVEVEVDVPIQFALNQNYPNPFNPSTKISYSLKDDGFVSLKVYNLLGIEIVRLVNENQKTGHYTINFDASNFPSGVYIYSLTTSGFNSSRKMILIK